MKKLSQIITFFYFALLSLSGKAQSQPGGTLNADSLARQYKPEIFTTGFIDILNNGQLNASARLIRLYVGEPGKFSVPLSFYSGVSANSFSNTQSLPGGRSNDHLVNNFINPLSGLVNVSVDGIAYFKASARRTKAGALYHVGEKVLTGFKTGALTDPQTGRPINFLNSFASIGLYFQTGSWEKNNAGNVGIFWLTSRYILCYTNPRNIQAFLPLIETNGLYHGYAIGGGVEINELVNIKILYYQYLKKPEIEYGQPIYQFSFNYALKK